MEAGGFVCLRGVLGIGGLKAGVGDWMIKACAFLLVVIFFFCF